ncbi:DNA polymerase IV [candidate division KSB1 bacterium]|nr:MAG: DNA polymerase IV [candidate division KSB1 bacterium]
MSGWINKKRIMHIDMDAFFASIEQRDLPSIKGKPVIVGGIPGSRGVVATCSYEARKSGITSGMPISEAKKRCPKAIFLRTYGKKYLYTAWQLLEIWNRFTPLVEPVSIDEAYLDITGSIGMLGNEEKIALLIKKEIREKLKLTCSIGIAPNKVFAKIASGLQKPDGLTIIKDDEVDKIIFNLPVSKLWGIGKKSEKVLNRLGIKTIGELANTPTKVLKQWFGINGELIQRIAKGEEKNKNIEIIPLDKKEHEKSIGNEHTFPEDTDSIDYIFSELMNLSQKTGKRLREKRLGAKTITLKLRYKGFFTTTHQKSFPNFIYKDEEIFFHSKALFNKIYNKKEKIRLIGISLSSLLSIFDTSGNPSIQKELFFYNSKTERLYPVLDSLKERFGEKIISRGKVLQYAYKNI